MAIGVCYSITNKTNSIELIVNHLTDFMFDQGWRVLSEVPATQNNKLLASQNEEWFDKIMYAEYTLKCYA